MIWSYGITTCAQRIDSTLPVTLRSLKNGGFDNPHLFIDGVSISEMALESNGLLERYSIVVRSPAVKAFGNFILGLWELYLRRPEADRYAMFQDDMICCRNLRQYLETVNYPDHGYLNLYTAGVNVKEKLGWSLSDQWGRGAVALVFDNATIRTFLGSEYMANHRRHHNGHKGIDKALIESAKRANYREWIHNPGLVQHLGQVSSIGNNLRQEIITAPTFVGEEFDAMDFDVTKLNSSRSKP